MKTKIIALASFLALLMTACFNFGEENKATLTLHLSGSSNSRAALTNWPPVNDTELGTLSYEIKLKSSSGAITEKEASGSDSIITFSVTPGNWTIEVTAKTDGELYAYGVTNAALIPGQNNVLITMNRAGDYEIKIDVLPFEISIPKGGNYTFTANTFYGDSVNNDDMIHDSYKWSVSGQRSGATTINESTGYLTVDLNETANTLTVKAKSANKDSIYGTAIVTVTEAPQYIVTFDANSGSGAPPAPQAVNVGSGITLPNQSTFSKTGYAFAGWNTQVDGTGTNYNANTSYTPTGDITLYAKWTPKPVAITLDSNGGTDGAVTSISGKVYDETVGSDLPSISPDIPTRSGHTFMGWSTSNVPDNTVNFDSTTVINAANGVTGADGASPTLTLYAVWNSTPSFTITFADIVDQAPGTSITGPTISLSGTGNPATVTISVLNAGEYTSFNWYIDGSNAAILTAYSITLNATNNAYNGVGEHYLTLEVEKGGILYSKIIIFTVTN